MESAIVDRSKAIGKKDYEKHEKRENLFRIIKRNNGAIVSKRSMKQILYVVRIVAGR